VIRSSLARDDAAERERNELNALLKQALEEREGLLAEREALLKLRRGRGCQASDRREQRA